MKGKPSVSGREELEAHISFFQQHFHFTLDQPKQLPRCGELLGAARQSDDTKLCLSMLKFSAPKKCWQAGRTMMLRNSKCV
jgi:hypothetical protein